MKVILGVLFCFLAPLSARAQHWPNQRVDVAEPEFDWNSLSISSPSNIANIALDFSTTTWFAIQIDNADGSLVVRVKQDGSVEYGPGFKADNAAKEFWDRVGAAYGLLCKESERGR